MSKRLIPILMVLALVAAACGDDDSSAATTEAPNTTAATTTVVATTAAPSSTSAGTEATTTTAAPDTTVAATTTAAPDTTVAATTTAAPVGGPTQFVISEVVFGGDGYVAITNFGGSGSLAGHWLCQRPSYFPLPDVEVVGGSTVLVAIGEGPAGGFEVVSTGASIGGLSSGSGEIGLYDSNNFGSADSILSYVEWGGSGHGRSGTAVEAGIWPEGGSVDAADAVSMILEETLGFGPDAWIIAIP